MALINKQEIEQYIPQKQPIVMVNELLKNTETTTVSSFTVETSNIFCEGGELQAPGLIENIAQTAALRMGYLASQNESQKEPPVGFIGAISKLSIKTTPKVGTLLTTTVSILNEIFGVTLIKGEVFCEGQEVAQCEMKIVISSAE